MTTPACPYCRSPSRGNPCWWNADHPGEKVAAGLAPPCEDYDDDMQRKGSARGSGVGFYLAWLAIFIVIGVAIYMIWVH